MTEREDELVEIRVIGLPVDVAARAQEHADELLREFTLIAASPRNDGHALPRQLTVLVEELTGQYGGFTAEQEQTLADAVRDGVANIDLNYRLPRTVNDAVIHLGELLDQADEYCRQGEHLLTLATPPEALAYRRWYLGEFTRQLAGEPPLSWQQWLDSHPLPTE